VERTFIFSDLGGFTSYTKRQGPHAAAALLAEFRHITRDIAAKRGVRVAKWLGDGAMLIGVEATPAIALGAHLIAHFRDTDVRVRVGIATGTVLLFEGDDYIGEPVNLAAKLCGAAAPGEILADCAPDGLPDWVHAIGEITVHVRGVGPVPGILRLQPAA
ncbi:MAG TPA: adenylate/guanylate cyclase domain-containing protein, partial [Acidimicrobiales bacterium]|nr:adenylate/guanylate cyclase domain-containing protein [Acidimicrobiales bacterium]